MKMVQGEHVMLGAGDQEREREIETWSQPRSGPEWLAVAAGRGWPPRSLLSQLQTPLSFNDCSLFVCFFPLVLPLLA